MSRRGRPLRSLLVGALALLGMGGRQAVAAQTPQKDSSAAVAHLPEVKQQPGRAVKQQNGMRSWRPYGAVWVGIQKRGNRRNRSRFNFNR